MIKIKNLFDALEADDGQRIWVEPVHCTLDFIEWCKVDHELCHIAPPVPLWQWFQNHPEGYDVFRAHYHEWLSKGPYRQALQDLVKAARGENYTLLHQGDDPAHNTATALWEFLSELEAYIGTE
jgi:uncharacterized protein YeaO (DUF488 family)